MQGKCACHDKHCWHLDVEKGQVTGELGLNDCADVGEVCSKVVHGIDGSAHCDGGADLAEVFLGFAKELLCSKVVCSVFVFFGKGLGVQDEVETIVIIIILH